MAQRWREYAQAACTLAVLGGFLPGALLFLLAPQGAGPAWVATAQAHGHTQLFGWVGLMVLGVGFHFLPRLRSARQLDPPMTGWALWLLLAGIASRLLAQPMSAGGQSPWLRNSAAWVLVTGAWLELAGCTLVLAILWRTLRDGPPLRQMKAMTRVMPFFLAGFLSLWGAALVNALAALQSSVVRYGIYPASSMGAIITLMLQGFIVPISVGMSARNLPILFRTRMPSMPLLWAGLAIQVAAVASSLLGVEGQVLYLLAAGLFTAGLRLLEPRRPRPRGLLPVPRDPAQLLALSAYLWLLVGALMAVGGRQDAYRHALGAGFATLLIFGVGTHLLPGFGKQQVRSRAVTWALLVAGNLTVLARVAPSAFPWLPGHGHLEVAAGVLGACCVVAFAWNTGLLGEVEGEGYRGRIGSPGA